MLMNSRFSRERGLAAGVLHDDLRRRRAAGLDLLTIGACERREELVIEAH